MKHLVLAAVALCLISPPRLACSQPIGPGFDCAKAAQPLARLICANADLSRTDLEFNQAYQALLAQVGPGGRRELQQEDVEFINYVQRLCGIPQTGLVVGSPDCVGAQYDHKRFEWISR
ncbi:MAG: DUF1311 domain-containing protein [Alphaproteobacteria bacterium]|nr:DUF1311 domain-containing protein [Alphaproteobacteria bacterium]